jgi:hypothetical protein
VSGGCPRFVPPLSEQELAGRGPKELWYIAMNVIDLVRPPAPPATAPAAVADGPAPKTDCATVELTGSLTLQSYQYRSELRFPVS